MVRGRPSSRTRRTYAHVADGFSFDYPQDCGGLAHRLRPVRLTSFAHPLHRAAVGVQMRLGFGPGVTTARAKSRTLYRTIWISDFHLGTDACQAEALLDFLRHHEAEKLYLVGDIVDGWNPGHSWCFDSAQKAVADEISAWRERGTYVEFLPGNHDQASLELVETLLGLVPRRGELIHRTAERPPHACHPRTPV